MYLCWSFSSTNTLFHILHSVYVSSEFPNVLVLTSPLQLCFLNNTSHVQTQAPNSLPWKRVFASLCNTRLPGAFCSDKATLQGACVPFCAVMVSLLEQHDMKCSTDRMFIPLGNREQGECLKNDTKNR